MYLIVKAFSVRILSSTPALRKVYCVVVQFYIYFYIYYVFYRKNRSGCTEKTSNINKHKQTCVQSAFYLESHQACDRSQAFPMRAEVR